MESFKATVLVEESEIWILVRAHGGHEILKARLPIRPGHPRALLTLLEGLALWSGKELSVALVVGDSVPPGSDFVLLAAGGHWPRESPLVQYRYVMDERLEVRRLEALGDFSHLLRFEP